MEEFFLFFAIKKERSMLLFPFQGDNFITIYFLQFFVILMPIFQYY